MNNFSFLPFDAKTVPLEGSNLIEASAGTGKTYSIAIMVLRLVVEQGMPVSGILMVTFTKAAVAELQERIRLFIRQADRAAAGEDIGDRTIAGIVDRAQLSEGGELVGERLRNAVLFLDETPVMTIHSFCQQTLNEFAFETAQLFGADMLPDASALIQEGLDEFWRRHITTLPLPLLSTIWTGSLRSEWLEALKEHLGGKQYFGYDPDGDYQMVPAALDELVKQLADDAGRMAAQEQVLIDYIRTNAAALEAQAATNNYAKKSFLPLAKKPKAFLDLLREKKDTGYVKKLFAEVLDLLAVVTEIEERMQQAQAEWRLRLGFLAIQEVGRHLRQRKERSNLLGYDDMIVNLHRALVERDNPRLVEALRRKYGAVFVDEFQDTDREQYEIFHTAFQGGSLLFYIGDPKQSIYAWRKADIFTYFMARASVDRQYSMNRNFRSNEALIRAMNEFFLPTPDFDTFFFGAGGDTIRYIPVESPEPNFKGIFINDDLPEPPLVVFQAANLDECAALAARQIATLLSGKYKIRKGGEERDLRRSDIGVLIRRGMEGRKVKAALAAMNIAAVSIDDSKVLQTEEAVIILHLLQAISTPDRSNINRALLSQVTGLQTGDIASIDDEAVLRYFGGYRTLWQNDGLYTAVMRFFSDFNVRIRLSDGSVPGAERVLSNLLQVTELVHELQSRKALSNAETIAWLQRAIAGMPVDGDAYEQRVESDEDAVRIVTIHRSKGLEYQIVLAPFLDFAPRKNQRFFSYRDPGSGRYFGIEGERMTDEQRALHREQDEQENRRLLYVAITRAVQACYIFRNLKIKASTLQTFLDALPQASPQLIHFSQTAPQAPGSVAVSAVGRGELQPTIHAPFTLRQPHWRRLSYTGLAGTGAIHRYGRATATDAEYDQFIFSGLNRGKATGELVHYLLERVAFGETDRWPNVIENTLRRYAPSKRESYEPMLRQMLSHIMGAQIRIGDRQLNLSAVSWKTRIAEFEFDFPVPSFRLEQLLEFSTDAGMFRLRGGVPEAEGMMNGKIDLFFAHEDRFYILDWKTNYLGDSVAAYEPDALKAAMDAESYHLQYLIYTVAVVKYLRSRVPGFSYDRHFGGVIYLFLRGVRSGASSGVFTARPEADFIAKLEGLLSPVDAE